MAADESLLPGSIKPHKFPAKLWRLVNNPAIEAIYWDRLGEVIIIEKKLFEKLILSPSSITSDSADAFKTTNFSSFIRQLHLYGFKKAHRDVKNIHDCHRFYNPNFKRNHPDLVANLMRHTADNKAKLRADLCVTCRPPFGSKQKVFAGTKNQGAAHPYSLNESQDMTAYSGTPVPPQNPMSGRTAFLSPSVFAIDKGILALKKQYPEVTLRPSAPPVLQGLLVSANHQHPDSTSFNTFTAQHLPCYNLSFHHYCHPNLVAGSITDRGLPAGLVSPQSYYQPGHPVAVRCDGERSHGSQPAESQEEKKSGVNLDTVFRIADDVMETPNNCPVKVVNPEKSGPALETSSAACEAPLCDSPASTVKEDFVVSVTQQMHEGGHI